LFRILFETENMKAVILKDFGSIDNFEMAEVAVPEMKDDEVLVNIKASPFNPIDYQMRRGNSESKFLKSTILGREMSGVVIEVGSKVSGFLPADEVAAYVSGVTSTGTYAEYISVPAGLLAKKPVCLSFEHAASLPLVGLTALQCVERLDLSANSKVFISGGAGGVGTILIQLLLAKGVKQVITTAGNEESSMHLRSLGLPGENIISYRQKDLAEKIKAAISNAGFDISIDLVGGSMSEVCANVLRINGIYADVAFLGTEAAKETLFDKAATILNIANYAHTLTGNRNDLSVYGKNLDLLFQKIEAGTLKPAPLQIVGELGTEAVKKAHLMLEANETKGKKLVMVHGDL
jgi:NADPH:quinone reductase